MTRSRRTPGRKALGRGSLLVLGILVLGVLVLAPRPVQATKSRGPNESPLYLAMWCGDSLDSGAGISLNMWVFRNYGLPGHPTQSKLIVESGAKVVRGVTATTLPVTDNTLWTVVLRKVGAGPIRVLATVRVPGDRKGSYYLDRERFEVGFQGQHVVRRDQSRVEAYYAEKGSKRLYEKR